MLKTICCVAAIALAAVTNASADFVDWFGGGVLTSVNSATCPTGNFGDSHNKAFHARYLHPNLGTNGPSASLTFLGQFYATNFVRPNGTFSLTTLETVKGTTVARFGGPYSPKLRLTKEVPTTITGTTPKIQMEGTIVGFPGFPGNNNCTVTFSLGVFRP